ncbi:phage repressor protein CI [Proteus mirabilis]|uniref:phage repressor protein CI n=1 Tax=Proteus TaxID=583 RepID=UPI0005053301|nr:MULTISPECIES: phage repressor protein CI [Proteus]KGA60294.1 repressor protein CI [Proteus vulgaris]MBG3019847.1 phage repressor protein CI [Proteus mirabilis]MCH4256569.1 helix-turn-helix domain-containing protein [Proteus vulgaris]
MSLQIDFTKGGSEVLDRVIEAYGFDTKIALALHFGIASSSLAMRYKRDLFPSDIVVRCALETGASLEWLAFGIGKTFTNEKVDILKIPCSRLVNGRLLMFDDVLFDKAMLKSTAPLPQKAKCIKDGDSYYILEENFDDIFDGQWLVDIEGKISIRELTLIPIKKVRVSGSGVPFDCNLDDLTVLGRVITVIENL